MQPPQAKETEHLRWCGPREQAVAGAVLSGLLGLVLVVGQGALHASVVESAHAPPAAGPLPTCAHAQFSRGLHSTQLFDTAHSCLSGFVGVGATIVFAWVAVGANASLVLEWACISSLSCPLGTQETVVYRDSGSLGSSMFDLASAGARYGTTGSVELAFWAGGPGDAGAPIAPGSSVVLGWFVQ